MAQALGERIGTGATADVHLWAPGQVVKLFKTAIPPRFAHHEAAMTRAVGMAAGPAPAVLGTVSIDGRFGIILPRLDGQTLMQLVRAGTVTVQQAGDVLAGLAGATHRTEALPPIPSLIATMTGLLRRHGDIPPAIAAAVLSHLRQLPAASGLCHGDLHPGNVIVTAAGPRLIDWLGAVRAAPAFDLAISQVMMAELIPQLVADPQRLRDLGAAFQFACSQQATAGLGDAIAAHLPVARLFALLTGPWSAVRPQMLARIAQELRQFG